MIRASVQSREFLRALAFHAEPMAWATNVETSRLENGTSQETWVLSVAGSAGAFQPVGGIKVMAAGTAKVLGTLGQAGDQVEIGPGQAVELEITPALDIIAMTLTLRRTEDSPASGCRLQVVQAGLAAAPGFALLTACESVRLDHPRFGNPQEGAWIAIGTPGH